jgi:hypothetical protein
MNTTILEPGELVSIRASAVAERAPPEDSMARSQFETFDQTPLLESLIQLSTDLVDLAFELEQRGRMDAADVANATAGRIKELCARVPSAGVEIDAIREAF